VLLVACFIHLYEAYGGFQPHFDYFHHLFWLKKKGGQGGSNVAGGCYLNMREGIRAEYLHCPWKTTLEDWYNIGFTSVKNQARPHTAMYPWSQRRLIVGNSCRRTQSKLKQ
jgi:hypothetical protein